MAKSRFIVQWNDHPMFLSKVFSSLVESQTLVDLTVNCNSYTIKVHKCVLAANSSYFRDHLQKDMSIDRVVINGIRHIVLKALIEFMYCGETSIPDENVDELIAAARFFCVRGISSIIPQKLTSDHFSERDCTLVSKPPLFFSKNDKKYTFKEKDNFAVYDSMGRRKHSHTKVTDEAHVALAKEEAASRFALEMLKKDINNTSNVFVIDETCTEATVETNLTAQYENNNNVMQIQEYVLQNEIKNDTSELVNEPNNIDINNLLPKTKQSPNDDRISELSNVPMLYKPDEGGYVNVNVSNQILESLSTSHAITYHVMPESGNVDFQQYICNNFGQYSMQLDAAQQDSSYEIVNNVQVQSEVKKPLTFTQLVADTVSTDFETGYSETPTSYDSILAKSEENVAYAAPEAASKLVNDEMFTPNYNDNFETDILDIRGKDVIVDNVVTPKKKRGRPPKRKIVEKNSDCDSSIADQKSYSKSICDSNTVQENLDQSINITSTGTEYNQLSETNKENEISSLNDSNHEQVENTKIMPLISQDENISMNSSLNENRRQTRSSFKFH